MYLLGPPIPESGQELIRILNGEEGKKGGAASASSPIDSSTVAGAPPTARVEGKDLTVHGREPIRDDEIVHVYVPSIELALYGWLFCGWSTRVISKLALGRRCRVSGVSPGSRASMSDEEYGDDEEDYGEEEHGRAPEEPPEPAKAEEDDEYGDDDSVGAEEPVEPAKAEAENGDDDYGEDETKDTDEYDEGSDDEHDNDEDAPGPVTAAANLFVKRTIVEGQYKQRYAHARTLDAKRRADACMELTKVADERMARFRAQKAALVAQRETEAPNEPPSDAVAPSDVSVFAQLTQVFNGVVIDSDHPYSKNADVDLPSIQVEGACCMLVMDPQVGPCPPCIRSSSSIPPLHRSPARLLHYYRLRFRVTRAPVAGASRSRRVPSIQHLSSSQLAPRISSRCSFRVQPLVFGSSQVAGPNAALMQARTGAGVSWRTDATTSCTALISWRRLGALQSSIPRRQMVPRSCSRPAGTATRSVSTSSLKRASMLTWRVLHRACVRHCISARGPATPIWSRRLSVPALIFTPRTRTAISLCTSHAAAGTLCRSKLSLPPTTSSRALSRRMSRAGGPGISFHLPHHLTSWMFWKSTRPRGRQQGQPRHTSAGSRECHGNEQLGSSIYMAPLCAYLALQARELDAHEPLEP